jgi:hypothetical protein
MTIDTEAGVAPVKAQPTSAFWGGRSEFGAATSNSIQIVRSHRPVLPWGGESLPWRIARFTVAFALIIVASHFLGGVLGRWFD